MTIAAGIPQGEACLGKTTINILEAEFYQAQLKKKSYDHFKCVKCVKPSNGTILGTLSPHNIQIIQMFNVGFLNSLTMSHHYGYHPLEWILKTGGPLRPHQRCHRRSHHWNAPDAW